ncbi:hypothetical protein RhiirC2_787028 [Rhizophagus irregularis]|uniref:Protein kinase domain-containing protein n=1 Tax=Rhizophagus irregularis TaxID=588596 RepID=A0A2N1MT29_9GLOM|nr:hypothetical protein RhiirC2_787028 [Rhizophagus irregularis]
MIWEYHSSCLSSNNIINFYGFTEVPNSSKYMVVMEYANKGNLRENLTRIVKNNWNQKLYMLCEIISGLNKIHDENLIHCDFHDGNILNNNNRNKDKIYISDLGLCQPVKSFLKNKKLNEMIASEDLSEYMLNLKSLDENTSKKLNEILESEDSQASVKANEMLVSEDLSDYIIKDLGSLDIKTDEN